MYFLKCFVSFLILVWSQAKPSGASIPVHVHADLDRKLLYVANWGGGAFVVYSLGEDNEIGEIVFQVRGREKSRIGKTSFSPKN